MQNDYEKFQLKSANKIANKYQRSREDQMPDTLYHT